MQATILLACADESHAGPFMTGGIFCIPAAKADDAVAQLREVKSSSGIAIDAKIHCRILFHDIARAKSPFRELRVDDCHRMLAQCVDATTDLGASWWGGWVDQDLYPSELQFVHGRCFPVTDKHLKGLAVFAALTAMEHVVGLGYKLVFDPDPTKIDWGLARRVQATHFSRIHPHAIEVTEAQKPLLELADIAAYTIAQSLLVDYSPPYLKLQQQRFPSLLRLMQMRTAHLAYTP